MRRKVLLLIVCFSFTISLFLPLAHGDEFIGPLKDVFNAISLGDTLDSVYDRIHRGNLDMKAWGVRMIVKQKERVTLKEDIELYTGFIYLGWEGADFLNEKAEPFSFLEIEFDKDSGVICKRYTFYVEKFFEKKQIGNCSEPIPSDGAVKLLMRF